MSPAPPGNSPYDLRKHSPWAVTQERRRGGGLNLLDSTGAYVAGSKYREDPTVLRATPVSLSVPRNLRKAKFREPGFFTGSHLYDVTGSPAAPPPVGRVHASLGSREDFSWWT